MRRLDAALNAQSPQLDAEQAAWEKSLAAGAAWTPLDPTDLRASSGANLTKDVDLSVFAFGDKRADRHLHDRRALAAEKRHGHPRRSAPDPRLPSSGPGRSKGGNFILSSVRVAVAPTTMPAATQPVEIATPRRAIEQKDYPASAALDDKPETGWAIGPLKGQPAAAEFFFKKPQARDGKSIFTITLDQAASAIPQHTLGRFRISVTNAPDADASAPHPRQHPRDPQSSARQAFAGA